MRPSSQRIITVGLTAALLGPSTALITRNAFATESNDSYAGIDSSYSERVEACTTAYHEAQDRYAELNDRMGENQARIQELEARLPELKQRAATSLRAQYKLTQSGNGFLDLLFSASDFNEFISTLQYLDIIQSKNLEALDDLVSLSTELHNTQSALDEEQREASDQLALAEKALEDAEKAREEARQAAIERAKEEERQRQAALEAARKRQGQSFSAASGRSVVVEPPAAPAAAPAAAAPAAAPSTSTSSSTPAAENKNESAQPAQEPTPAQPAEESKPAEQKPADSAAVEAPPAEQAAEEPKQEETPQAPASDSRSQFIAIWGPRIDAFNEGYPLGGYGAVFAAAAYDYGVDPRWSPAIARIESGSGEVCFADHNAWGWGASEWPDWETAITEHVAGLGHGYGYTNSLESARTYCPPNADLWYTMVSGYMTDIWPTDQL